MTVTTAYSSLIAEQLYIGGWREGTSERTAETTNPFNNETIATIRQASKEDVDAVTEICGGPADYVLDCTGSIRVIEQAADAVGLLGTFILVGGAPAEARFSVDHMRTLFGKKIVGTLGGSSTSHELIQGLIELYRQGRFPFDQLVKVYGFDEIDQAIADAHEGGTIKAVLKVSETKQ